MFLITLSDLLTNFNPNKLNPTTAILLIILTPLVLFLIVLYFFIFKRPSCKVFLVDFSCYNPPTTQMCTREEFLERVMRPGGNVSEDTMDFMKKVVERSGLGDSTYIAEALLTNPRGACLEDSRREVEKAVFGSIDMLLAKTGVECEDIGILVVNCCIFSTVPSLSSMIVNQYKLGEGAATYNLTGMGCSAGLVAIGLAKNLLQVHQNCYALVVSTESLTENCYIGNDLSKVLTNCAFRLGGAAVLLSNRHSDHRSSKYHLLHAVHTHTASSDLSYNCIIQEEDDCGNLGITVTKDLLVTANNAIQSNLTSTGHLILPLSEKLLFLTNQIVRKILRPAMVFRPYVPGFNKVVDHFFSHVGGKPVLDELQRNLGFSDVDMEASRMTLYRFGNTSSSSVWYELAYAEAKGRVKKGDRVWQIAFGSGFKCSSVIWRAMRSVGYDESNPWSEEIDRFPVFWDKNLPAVVLDKNGSVLFSFTPSK